MEERSSERFATKRSTPLHIIDLSLTRIHSTVLSLLAGPKSKVQVPLMSSYVQLAGVSADTP